MKRITTMLVAASLLPVSLVFADATVEQKTQVRLGGAIGGIANAFGGKATHEGSISTTALHGDRKSTNSGSTSEIIDLGEEKIYRLDNDRRTYKVVTFAELRKQFEDAQKRADKQSAREQKGDGTEWDVDVDIRDTGKRETINEFKTHETLITVSVHEKGKKIDQSGGFILRSDMWLGPRIPAMKELSDFDRRYFAKLYSGLVSGVDMAQMAMIMSQTPAFGKAMKAFAEKKSTLEGTPIRTTLTFVPVSGPDGEARNGDDSQSAAAAALGSLFGRMKKHDSNADEKPGDRDALFTSSTEILQAKASASAAAVAIPANYKQH